MYNACLVSACRTLRIQAKLAGEKQEVALLTVGARDTVFATLEFFLSVPHTASFGKFHFLWNVGCGSFPLLLPLPCGGMLQADARKRPDPLTKPMTSKQTPPLAYYCFSLSYRLLTI